MFLLSFLQRCFLFFFDARLFVFTFSLFLIAQQQFSPAYGFFSFFSTIRHMPDMLLPFRQLLVINTLLKRLRGLVS